MKNIPLLARQGRPCFTLEEISEILGLARPSARVFVSRKVKSGELVRARRDLYLLPEFLKKATEKDLFLLSNMIQTPSYVSFVTALSWYGLTTAILPSVVEAANPVRSCLYKIENVEFRYRFCPPARYFGFERKDRFFIATPEKALLDCLSLCVLGRYALDLPALDLKGFAWGPFQKLLKRYPSRFRSYCQDWRKNYEDARAA